MDVSLHIYLTSIWGLSGIAVLMLFAWVLSLRVKDASIVDRLWGLNFILLAWIYFSQSQVVYWRHWAALFMVCIWGARLSLHIHLRNRGHSEDYRYQSMRNSQGRSFWWYSLFSVFLFQGLLAFLISAPILWIFAGTVTWFSIFDPIAIFLWGLGFYFEVVGDSQLRKFKSDPHNKGKILDRGLWSLTRHPNYFGDALMWWALFLLALPVANGWMAFYGPLIMSIFLRYVSGVPLIEKSLSKTKPGYDEYMNKTPAFTPKLGDVFMKVFVLRFLEKIKKTR